VKILCLFVRHGSEQYPDALPLLDQWYERHGLLGERTLWIIDNARPPGQLPQALGPRILLRSGDNQAWEFSAWSQAIRQAQTEGVRCDLVHFVTSAYNTLYTEYLQHFRPDMLAYVTAHNSCLGHIDSSPQPNRLGPTESQYWTRTCFFFLSWATAQRVNPWAAFGQPELFFAGADSRQFRPDAPLSADYRSHITSWLEGQEMGGHTWHSPVGDGAHENRRFQLKALAILNEHRLAITLRAAGIRLVDFCWLHAQRETPVARLPNPPPELAQLMVRRKILGIPE